MLSHHRGWLYPPTRRELTLLLFSLTVFVISYNLETSLHLIGIHPAKLSGSYLSTIGFGTRDPGFDRDGRRPKEWRDELETLIAGEWDWDEHQIAGVDHGLAGLVIGNTTVYNIDSGAAGRSAGMDDRGIGLSNGVAAHTQFLRWGGDVPVSRAVAHVPGYTIIHNAIVANGTFFLVTDDPASLPELAAIASSSADRSLPPREQDWQILSREEARSMLGNFGGRRLAFTRIFGTTWISLDPATSQDPYALFSLLRTQSTLALSDRLDIPAPLRLMFPHIPTFSSPHIPPEGNDVKQHPPQRIKSYVGIHPFLPKAILSAVGIWYMEDWQDIADMNVPWLFDRVIIADRSAADRSRELWARGWSPPDVAAEPPQELKRQVDTDDGKPSWAAPFVGLKAKEDWWTPMRSALLTYLKLPASQQGASASVWAKKFRPVKVKPIVTYVSMQAEPTGAGARLHSEDHAALVAGLQSLETDGVIDEFHVVHGNGSLETHGSEWTDRMSAFAKSSIVLGPYGYHLADSIFMALPGRSKGGSAEVAEENGQVPAPLLMEFFPPGTFMRDQEFAVRSLGMRYMAWWNDRKFTGNSLPPVIRPDEAIAVEERFSISADAVIQSIREEIRRGSIS
ncbi:uncharacterized protein FIBRA_01610 [Fibroporia radiculosa]|uniref:Uncharacterized protein n=1 Tax=Fibroporia radiculosa TaxID=599839 RepID=J4HTL8_9APHY|nr:uncharacterized protein FIBRA_01610 [Fibroporia radiculosa]CCL99592.1 predicted protein [Fibroporia radiculosa]